MTNVIMSVKCEQQFQSKPAGGSSDTAEIMGIEKTIPWQNLSQNSRPSLFGLHPGDFTAPPCECEELNILP